MYVCTELEGSEENKFSEIQNSLGLKSRSEVVRYLIKQFSIPKEAMARG